MFSFKLEGGEWFKWGFRKLLKIEWNSLQETRLGIQFAKNKAQYNKTPEKQLVVLQKQSVVSQKQSVVYTSK